MSYSSAMRTFLVALEIEPVEVGQTYDALPLHCTVMHWFRTGASAEDLLDVVAPIVESTSALKLTAGPRDLFGPSQGPHHLPVNRLQPTEALAVFHGRLLEGLETLGVVHTEPEYTGDSFVFHVTMQHGVRFDEGQTHLATVAYLAEAQDQKRIARKHIQIKVDLRGGPSE